MQIKVACVINMTGKTNYTELFASFIYTLNCYITNFWSCVFHICSVFNPVSQMKDVENTTGKYNYFTTTNQASHNWVARTKIL